MNIDPDAVDCVDARGLYCPLPLIRLQQRIRSLEKGATLWLLADDAGVEDDLPLWCQSTGNRLCSLTARPDGCWLARIEKN